MPGAIGAAEPVDPSPGLVQDIFSDRPINDGSGVLAIECLTARRRRDRAGDIAFEAGSPTTADTLRAITLVIDQNPAPMAAKFESRAGRQGLGDLNARSRQQLHQCSCRGRTQRRQALHGQDLREGIRRLFGTRRQKWKRRAIISVRSSTGNLPRPIRARPTACAKRRSWSVTRTIPGYRWTRSPISTFRPSSSTNCTCGRITVRFVDGGRHFHLGRSQYPLHLCLERCEDLPRRGKGYVGPSFPEAMERRQFRQLTLRCEAVRMPSALTMRS